MSLHKILAAMVLLGALLSSCKDEPKTNNHVTPPITADSTVKGYNLLYKICGIWDGPVTSSTPLGGYPEWIVDFRPISASQVSAKNELDTLNDIFMSFFVVYDSSSYKLAFRNGGSFAGMKRSSYMVCDSVLETPSQSYYRFVDFVKGASRTISEVIFKGDSLILRSYTNKYNTVTTPTLHMEWRARLQDTTSCQAAKTAFNYPQKTMVKDFSTTFDGLNESIYFQLTGDPYPESAQPYLGRGHVSYSVLSSLPVDPSKTVLLFATTQPLIAGFSPNIANLKYRSRYVILSAAKPSFTFNYMHPGTYYLYAFYDADGNRSLSSGDYVSTTNTSFTLSALGDVSASTQINYRIP